jgi:hypothetical protein
MSMSHSFGTLQNLLLFWDTTHHIIDDTSLSNYEIQVSLIVDTSRARDLGLGCRARQSLRISTEAVVFFVE